MASQMRMRVLLFVCAPPDTRRPRGRPYKKRNQANEYVMQCSRWLQKMRHNARTCSEPVGYELLCLCSFLGSKSVILCFGACCRLFLSPLYFEPFKIRFRCF
ncbi:hypothetical protein POJ06DRAFT_257568 [Lipomyces tetrasporus]|uniref:Uncharacterized protein n=1 Tax=Lipomyces tetrasporus TaxID=54092 RepID=A0AAD7VRG7_9ASCO|nr:uncharacterized protein POJ06DRAFT_257568 [Lipomyces tetrasporus]KAJ8098634.1 hypothetical protein POJ06DRAFT_257568 [Lipomyces tetrasporus]